jgi:hypothetical protein
MTKDLVKTSDLENIVTGIVKKLFSKFESSLEKKMNEKIIKIQNDIQIIFCSYIPQANFNFIKIFLKVN